MGLDEGGTVAIMLRNDIPFIESILAATRVGAYSVPINWHYKTEEVNYILADSEATHLVIHSDLLHEIREGIPDNVTVLCVPTPPEICEAYGISRTGAVLVRPDGCVAWRAQSGGAPEGTLKAVLATLLHTSTNVL